MSRYWSEVVRQLVPYVPGEQPQVEGLIKLNTNESPYPPSPRVQQILDRDVVERLRLYPDPNSRRLKQAIADYYRVPASRVFVGNGSDEVLALAFMAFFQQPQPLLYPDISYGFYPVYCQLFGIENRQVPLREDFRLALEDYRQPNGGIVFPNPNAPTGMALPLADIEALLQDNPDTVVLVDEAYVDFGAETAVSLVDRYPNLLVVQTLSKSRSLAGLRLGFAIGQEDLMEGLERVKNSFNSYPVDRLAELAATAAMEDVDYFQQCRDQVIANRDWTSRQLAALGFTVLPSQANFVFAQPPGDAAQLADALRQEGILVRYFARPPIDSFLRISIGSREDMERLVNTLKTLLN